MTTSIRVVSMMPRIRSTILLMILLLLVLTGRLAGALTPAQAHHLLVRTGFEPAPDEITQLARMSPAEAVDTLLGGGRTQAGNPLPDWISEPLPTLAERRAWSPEERQERLKLNIRRGQQLKGWWFGEMRATDSPLTERMTLFWHNHFTSSLQKVKQPQFLAEQNALLRRHALGNFRELTHAIVRDRAMLLYLDNQTNRRGQPNENFARELLELFTLGEGHYTEHDIKQAARAFTGLQMNRANGEVRFNSRAHEPGPVRFMGRSGDLSGDDIIAILMENPATARNIVEKLWREFISPEPDPVEVERLAELFRRSDYEIAPLMRELLLTPAFFEPDHRGTLVKSPVELLVGVARQFDLPVRNPAILAFASRRLGQDLLNPPNVKGWPGGTEWIRSDTLLLRYEIMHRLLTESTVTARPTGENAMMMRGGRNRMMTGLDAGHLERWLRAIAPVGIDAAELAQWTLPLGPVKFEPVGRADVQTVRAILSDPAYQLK